jgi:hypothetical protein
VDNNGGGFDGTQRSLTGAGCCEVVVQLAVNLNTDHLLVGWQKPALSEGVSTINRSHATYLLPQKQSPAPLLRNTASSSSSSHPSHI